MNTDSQAKSVRLFRLAILLSRPPMTRAAELAEHLDIPIRTVYRDLASLGDMGLPLVRDNNRWGLENAGMLPHLQLEPREVLALYFAVAVARQRLGTLSPALEQAFAKLRNRITGSSDLDELTDKIQAPTARPDRANGRVLELLSAAIAKCAQVRMLYQPLHRPASWRQIQPGGFFLHDDTWYIWAQDVEKGDQRRFRVNRIQELQVLDIVGPELPRPNGGGAFHPWDLEDQTPTEVVLEITPELAAWLEENPPHPSQQIDQGKPIRCTYKVRSPERMLPYLASLDGFRLLRPESLRQALVRRVTDMADSHRGGELAKRPPAEMKSPTARTARRTH